MNDGTPLHTRYVIFTKKLNVLMSAWNSGRVHLIGNLIGTVRWSTFGKSIATRAK